VDFPPAFKGGGEPAGGLLPVPAQEVSLNKAFPGGVALKEGEGGGGRRGCGQVVGGGENAQIEVQVALRERAFVSRVVPEKKRRQGR
jgi:hypothetical protein